MKQSPPDMQVQEGRESYCFPPTRVILYRIRYSICVQASGKFHKGQRDGWRGEEKWEWDERGAQRGPSHCEQHTDGGGTAAQTIFSQITLDSPTQEPNTSDLRGNTAQVYTLEEKTANPSLHFGHPFVKTCLPRPVFTFLVIQLWTGETGAQVPLWRIIGNRFHRQSALQYCLFHLLVAQWDQILPHHKCARAPRPSPDSLS